MQNALGSCNDDDDDNDDKMGLALPCKAALA